jgi:tetratricopeptide (TPR) repeat protein
VTRTGSSSVRVLIGTTNGPVDILSLHRENRAIRRSVVCIRGTTERAGINRGYEAFVNRKTGLIERAFGGAPFRVDVSERIDAGFSWQLGFLLSHALSAADRLSHETFDCDVVVWATGTVRNDLTVGEIGYLDQKINLSMGRLSQERHAGKHVLVAIPSANSGEIDNEAIERIGAQLVELDHVRQLLRTLALPPIALEAAAADRIWEGSPYRSLEPFERRHRDIFFGRGRAREEALERLRRTAARSTAFLLIYGRSGAGKSSLVRAGLLGDITSQASEAEVWIECTMTPQRGAVRPVDSLAQALAASLSDAAPPDWARSLSEGFRARNPSTIEAVAEAVVRTGRGRRCKLLLVIDQLEELLVWAREQGGADRVDERDAFAQAIADLSRSGAVWVIATLRSDMLPLLEDSAVLSRLAAYDRVYRLERPTWVELKEIVLRPAVAAKLRLEGADPTGLSFSEVLINAASQQPDSLPLLQFVLSRLFEMEGASGRLTYAAYDRLGGLEGAIGRWAEESVSALGDDEEIRAAVDVMILNLGRVDRETTTVVARTAILEETSDSAAREKVVEALRAARLIVLDEVSGARTARVAHEALLHHWPRADALFKLRAREIELRGKLEQDAVDWDRSKRESSFLLRPGRQLEEARELSHSKIVALPTLVRDYIDASVRRSDELADAERKKLAAEARRERNWRRAAVAAGFLLLVLTTAALVFAYKANQQTNIAQSQQLIAEAQTKRAEDQTKAATESQKLAEEQRAAAEGAMGQALEQRQRAEQAIAAATDTANGLVFDLARRLRHAMGVPAALIKDILYRARALQQQLAQPGQVTPELQLSAAAALSESANTLLTIGDTAGALIAANQAREILESLLATNPSTTDWQRELSVSFDRIGNVLLTADRRDEALAAYQKGLAILERLRGSNLANAEWQRDLSVTYQRIGDMLLAGDRRDEALALFQKKLAIVQNLADSDPRSTGWQRELSVSYDNIGDVLAAGARREEALASYQNSLAIRERCAAGDPDDARWQSDLSVSNERIGDLLRVAGRHEEALAAYQKKLAIREKVAASSSGNARWQRDLSVSYNNIGDLLVVTRRHKEALAVYQKSLVVFQRLAARDPDNTVRQRELSVSYQRVGDVLVASGQHKEGLAAYQRSLAIVQKLATSDPGNDEWQRDLSVSYERIGDVLLAVARRKEALAAYQKSVAIREKFNASDPDNAEWQRDLSVTSDNIGEGLVAVARREETLAAYQKRLAIREQLAANEPHNAQWQRFLSHSYDSIGYMLRLTGRREEALAAYQKSVAIREKFAASDPGNDGWQRDLLVSYINVGDMLLAAGWREEALTAYQKALTASQECLEAAEDNVQCYRLRELSIRRIVGIGHDLVLARDFAKALGAVDQAIEHTDDIWLYTNRAHALMFLGRIEEARALYLKYRGESGTPDGRSWVVAVLQDFAELRKNGLTSPLMDEIEKLFAEEM